MSLVTEWVEVGVPAHLAYQSWKRFEDFPKFMWGVNEVSRTGDTEMHWVTSIAGVKREFDAKITEDVPEQRIVWQYTGGVEQSGEVDFVQLDDAHCRVTARITFVPHGAGELVADKLGFVQRRVKEALEHFRGHVEAQWAGKPDALRREYNRDKTNPDQATPAM